MKPTACKESKGLPLETKPGNIAKHAKPVSPLFFGYGLVYKFPSDAETEQLARKGKHTWEVLGPNSRSPE